MKHILLVPNTQKDKELAVTKQVAAYIADRAKLFLHEDYRGFGVEAAGFRAPDEVYSGIDCIIVLGGDGTLLGVAREATSHKIPILGINLGRLGFLAEVERHEIEACLDKLLAGAYTVENRMMIHAVIRKASGSTAAFDALNDIVISRTSFSRLLDLNVYVNDEFVDDYKADGIIIATPTGSTAYSMSAGGPIVDPSVNTFLITPICPHKMYSRTIIVPESKSISVVVNDKHTKNAMVTADGQEGTRFELGDRLEITKSVNSTGLIRVSGSRFYSVLRHKLAGKESSQ